VGKSDDHTNRGFTKTQRVVRKERLDPIDPVKRMPNTTAGGREAVRRRQQEKGGGNFFTTSLRKGVNEEVSRKKNEECNRGRRGGKLDDIGQSA